MLLKSLEILNLCRLSQSHHICISATDFYSIQAIVTSTPTAPNRRLYNVTPVFSAALCAIANRLNESWVAYLPWVPLLYLNQYTPDIFKQALMFLVR